ncbi:PREDICTED: cilia- and flagella-associated protein 54 isoform X2 [Gavialis gangeticus]|uniref:cilia- and flagella-associated protein 54 isoform X2 n=1 Tax=Gavialis gangeticus TaxID=94835 RepID=UPI00092F9B5B|nr:PREDICTED: cilia- and flagella-associated protein 54 isoform X2 [Gavialis gangeticus]
MLFDIWIKYKPQLPDWYYNEKLLKVGDLLIQIKEYKLALLQCYGRYLQQFSSINIDEVIADVNQFKSIFFPSGFRDKNAALTFRALQERNICIYQMVCSSDRNLQNQESLQTCFSLLSSLRLIMQVALPQESLCWLIYNGTIYIYTICRHLMSIGQSVKVLEYLLWASVCMESSVPLLSVHYLTWRTTLYTAVCQCYYDCRASIHGEVFARRGLSKIDELKQLESASSSPQTSETKNVFREATIKMAVMVFKRSVYESRRKPKGYFRPKLRVNLKEAQHLPWPRTVTERLLTEMFDGTSAQFLAIIEALSDSNRRLLHTAPSLPEEPEIRDVISELFFAGMEILSGGGSSTSTQDCTYIDPSGVINASSTLLQLILTGKNGVSGDAAVQFIKLAFSYEEWDAFDSTIGLVVSFLQDQDDPVWKKAEMELRLLIAMQPVVSARRSKHGLSVQENIREVAMSRNSGRKTTALREGSLKPGESADDLVILATTVLSCVCTSKQNFQPDREILVDVIMFLWQKCKVGVQRIQTSGSDYLKYIHKYKAYKWIHIHWIINEVIQNSNIGDTNAMLAEVTLRLSAILENIADCANKSGEKNGERNESELLIETQIFDIPEILKKSPAEQLHFAYESLEKAINGMNMSRLMTLSPDGKSVYDHCCTKMDPNGQNLRDALAHDSDKAATGNHFVMDLHLELIRAQHRIAVKLFKLTRDVQMDGKNFRATKSHEKDVNCFHLTETDIMNKVKKNKLSKAIFLMQKAALMYPKELASAPQKQLLEEALTLIQKVEAEQNKLYSNLKQSTSTEKNRVPPPPILVSRSHCSMTFKPAPFTSDVQVSWYRIFGCVAAGINTKVRLNNYHLPNAGEEVPADGKSLLEIKGLNPNEKYIFAVAAYSSDGKLIGDAIGETTKPILAYPPLSATTARAYLTQIAYQTGSYTLAKKAFSPVWNYFVSSPSLPSADSAVIFSSNNFTISPNRLSLDDVSQASPFFLHLFLRNIFILNDIHVKEAALFCDSIHSNDILYNEQVTRLVECERMLVAIELANWLNDANYALQAVVQCYSLLAPIIYHKISSVPVVQILIKCLTVLQELPVSTSQRKQAGCYESIQHMIACSSFYTAKVLRSWQEYELAIIIINYGKKLLDSSQTTSRDHSGVLDGEEMRIDTDAEDESACKKTSQAAAVEKATENLTALESNLLKLTKPGTGSDLTGQEDPFFLYPIISCWSTKNAYKEVLKFKKKPRFLEFFVQVLHQTLNEDKFQRVLEWAGYVQDFLKRRNRQLLGIKGTSGKEGDGLSVSEDTKRYTTAVVEFQKKSETPTLKNPRKEIVTPARRKDTLRQYYVKRRSIRGKSPEAQRKMQEELQKVAFHTLVTLLNPVVSNHLKRKKFHQACLEEMPWRSQMNIYLAITQFCLFKKKLEDQYNIGFCSLQHLNSYDVLDHEIFSLNNSGIIVVREGQDVNLRAPSYPLLKKSHSEITKGITAPAQSNFMVPSTEAPSVRSQSAPPFLNYYSVASSESEEQLWSIRSQDPVSSVLTSGKGTQLCARHEQDRGKSSENSVKMNEVDTPRTQMTNSELSLPISTRDCDQSASSASLLEHFTKTFLHLRRAVVLAHRGGHWTLLQNACRELWNYTQEVEAIARHSNSLPLAFPITRGILINTIWFPFYLASDTILDMMNELQTGNSLKIVEPEGDFCVPSCVGGIADEEGGSDFTLHSPLDDVNVIDLKWICHLILKTLELLYKMKKWEALVHIAMQFNITTHERYAEQVTPLLVYAQRRLLERIQQFRDPDSPEPYFIKKWTDNVDKINCRNYIAKQSHVISSVNKVALPEDHSDPEVKIIYAGDSQAKALVCVPLDVKDTLKCFRETLEKSKYHSRALRHSRKLLSLFLAHTQDPLGRLPSQSFSNKKVGFGEGAELTFLPSPPDLSQEMFNFPSMLESRPLPQSQLPVVISSYEKTVEVLQINNQRDLKVQALHELGNLHVYAGNKKAAFKYWCQALDETLNVVDVLNNWQKLGDFSRNVTGEFTDGSFRELSNKFISEAGVWGCLHAAVLSAKIAQYMLPSNVKMRTKCCIFSAILFKTLFSTSLPHPTADCDFAQYEINKLIPGIDLFSDRYRADVPSVVASLYFLMFELHCSKQNLIVLPLFTLYQYFVSEICRDPVKCIEGRILKFKVLTDSGFFTEALNELSLLNHGGRTPWKRPTGCRPLGKNMVFQKFDPSKSLLSSVNLQVLEDIFNWSLPPAMISMCNKDLMNKLTLAKMHFIICLSATINTIPEEVMKTNYIIDNTSFKKRGRSTDSGVRVNAELNSQKQEQSITTVQLVRCKDELNMAMLKNEYDRKISQFSAVELEIVVEAKLQVAAISQQRHQAAFSAALAFSAIRFFQDANIFKKKMTHFQPGIQDYYDKDTQLPDGMMAREHLNAHLWLKCRTALVTAVMAQIRGISDVKANDMSQCVSLINEVIIEAEAFGDIDTQAEMMMQAVILDLHERRPVADIKPRLQDIISLLQKETFISPQAALTLVKSMLLLADILAVHTEKDRGYHSSTNEPLNLLILAHKLTVKQMFTLGESVEQQHEDTILTSPVLPLKNLFLPHINLLAKVKMRIGHVLVQEVACTSKREDPLQWLPALRHLEAAVELCTTSVTRELDLEAEVFFQKGRVERQIIEAGSNKSPLAAKTLLHAIKVSLQNDQNFELIRKSYLEIALLYFHLAKSKEEDSQRVKKTSKIKPLTKEYISTEKIPHISEVYKAQAWIAIRAAMQVSEATVASQLLIGRNTVKGHEVKDVVQQRIPEFASLDLLASYEDFLSDGYDVVYKNLLASSIRKEENMQPEKGQTENEATQCGASTGWQRKPIITWVHLVRYHNYLKQLNSTSPTFGPGSLPARDALFTSVFDTGIVLRLTEMHLFLKKHLPLYSTCCPDDFPKELRCLEKPVVSLADPIKMSVEADGTPQKVSVVRISSTVSFSTDIDKESTTNIKATNAPNKELCIQWYLPFLEKSSNEKETMVLLLYAYNTKQVKVINIRTFNSASVFSGHLWIPLTRIISLQDKLSNLKEQIESCLQASTSFPLQIQNENQKKMAPTQNKINNTKMQLDEKTQEMVKQCLCEVKALLSGVPDLLQPLTEVPFDITLQSIMNLETMFDPANGSVIMGGSLFNWIISLFP